MTRCSRLPGYCLVVMLLPGTAAAKAPLVQVGAIHGPADLVQLHASHAYVAAGPTLTIYDVSEPAVPVRLGSHTFSARIWDFVPQGPLLYVAADVAGLAILDVSDPRTPRPLGSLKTRGQVQSIALAGSKVLLADQVSGVDVVDVSTPAQPRLINSLFVEGYAKAVAAVGTLAYVADRPTGFYVFDVAKVAAEPIVALQTATTGARGQMKILGLERHARAVLASAGAIQVYDITAPAAPRLESFYRTPAAGPVRIAVDEVFAFVADGTGGLQVLNMTDPSRPTVLETHSTKQAARDVAVQGSLVCVVVGPDEVLLFARSSPAR